MHGIDLTTQMDIFYHSMNYASKGIIDAACCRAFKRKSAGQHSQVKWGETISNQAEALPLFTERCGSNLV